MEAGYPIPTLLQTTLNVVAFFFPLMLFTVWAALAFADLGTRTDLSPTGRFGWSAAILALPWLGAAGYHVVGRSTVPSPVRLAMIGGGIVVYLAFLGLGRLVGGIS
jgi:hypothetical protein